MVYRMPPSRFCCTVVHKDCMLRQQARLYAVLQHPESKEKPSFGDFRNISMDSATI